MEIRVDSLHNITFGRCSNALSDAVFTTSIIKSVNTSHLQLSDLQRKSVQRAIQEESTVKQKEQQQHQQGASMGNNTSSQLYQGKDKTATVENIGSSNLSFASSASRRYSLLSVTYYQGMSKRITHQPKVAESSGNLSENEK